jgi:hypothetical protein
LQQQQQRRRQEQQRKRCISDGCQCYKQAHSVRQGKGWMLQSPAPLGMACAKGPKPFPRTSTSPHQGVQALRACSCRSLLGGSPPHWPNCQPQQCMHEAAHATHPRHAAACMNSGPRTTYVSKRRTTCGLCREPSRQSCSLHGCWTLPCFALKKAAHTATASSISHTAPRQWQREHFYKASLTSDVLQCAPSSN